MGISPTDRQDGGGPPGAWRSAAWAAAVLSASVGLGLALTAALLPALAAAPEPLRAWLFRKGAGKILSRVLMFTGLALLPVVLRGLRARWPDDLGWRRAGPDDPPPAAALGWGALAGLAMLAALGGAAWASGARGPDPAPPAGMAWTRLAAGAIVTAGVVSLLEETLLRGLLFRALARAWGWIGAALALSLFAATVHFIIPRFAPADALARPWPGRTVWLAGTLTNGLRGEATWALRMVNLALMGLVFCGWVRRSGTIWPAVGAHAAFIWGVKLHAAATAPRTGGIGSALFGRRSDFTDAPALAVVLALWAIRLWRRAPARGTPPS